MKREREKNERNREGGGKGEGRTKLCFATTKIKFKMVSSVGSLEI